MAFEKDKVRFQGLKKNPWKEGRVGEGEHYEKQ